MKKTLFALAVLCEISFGMNPRDTYRGIADQFEKYENLYEKWRIEFSGYENFEKRSTPESAALEKERDAAKPEDFDPAILEAVIRHDIGSDDSALQAFQLFSDCKLHELIDFYPEASTKMLPINAERFREILLLLAPILSVQREWDEDLGFTSMETYQEYISKIVSVWGGDPSAITFNAIQHPQFCFEMFLMQVLKPGHLENGILFQAVMCMVDEFLTQRHNWDGKKGETAIYSFSTGCYEDDGGRCAPKDVWPNWKTDITILTVTGNKRKI
jgi:hypothetical protein